MSEHEQASKPLEEATKVMPAVTGTPRRRRTQHTEPAQETQVQASPSAEAASTQTAPKTSSESRGVYVQELPRPASPLKNATPRPQALERTERDRREGVRYPVNAPGYSRRQPLGYDAEADAIQKERMEAQQTEAPREGHPVLVILTAIVLILGVLVLGLHLIPEESQTPLGTVKRALIAMLSPEAAVDETLPETLIPSDTEAHPVTVSASSGNAPMEILFSMETADDIEEVRLLNAYGEELETATQAEAGEGTISWIMHWTVENDFSGTVQVQTLYDGEWNDLGEPVMMQIGAPQPIREISTQAPVQTAPDVVLDFSASPRTGTAPVNVAFSMSTSLGATDIRLVNENGEVLDAEGSVLVENSTSRIWALNLTFEDSYNGTVKAQVLSGDTWMDSDKSVTLAITGNPATIETPMPMETSVAMESLPEMTDTPSPTQEIPAVVLPLEETPTPVMESTEDAWEIAVEEPEEVLPTAVPTPEPAPEPEETAQPRVTVTADESADPSLIRSATIYVDTKSVASYDRPVEEIIDMPDADHYARQPYGVMTYRGSSFRQNAAEGTVSGTPSAMNIRWRQEAGSVKGASSTYYGIGWTGQPLIVKWSKEIREMSNIFEDKKNTKALREVIIAGEDGKIYFLDLETGEATRDVIQLGYPMRGTPSVHAMGFPVMAVGQYARKMSNKTGDIGLRVYDLLTQKQAFMLDGLDGKTGRPYYGVGSFETSSLYDYSSDTMISAGTNGMLYTTRLNTAINRTQNTLTMDPQQVVLRTKAKGEEDKQTAVESSLAAYQNYVFYADMAGILRCVDTSTMTTLWAVDTGDSVEAAVALDLDAQGQLWLYTANTLQQRSKGDCAIRRYDALSGRLDWEYLVPVTKATKKHNVIGGCKASPVIGRSGLNDYVYFTLSSAKDVNGSSAESVLIALDKASGTLAWQKPFSAYTYSSPVAVYTEEGRGSLIQATSDGTLYLLDGLSGQTVSTLQVEGTIHASPAVYKDILVIGTQGKDTSFIYGIDLQ
ncbi:MAG: PQQ-binding-like beta-propeller repeat protein [Clostridia bacterium]|nr:PQQ-binding-like beta-propeller repeat protein [Clostridia bacterium]